jgi:hypothetical protein
MFLRWLGFAFVVLLAGCSGLASQNAVANQPAELVIIEGANAIKRVDRGDGRYELAYELEQRYPAESVTARIKAVAAPDRWHPLEQDWLNPDLPGGLSRGWLDFVEATKKPNKTVYVWNAEWRSDAGSLLVYNLKYESAIPASGVLREPDNPGLHVHAAIYPAGVVEATRKQLGITGSLR